MKHQKYLHYLYIPADFLISLLVGFLSFFAYFNIKGFDNHLIPALISSLAISVLLILVLFVFRTYRILSHSFGLIQALKSLLYILIVEAIYLLVILSFLRDILNIDFTFVWIGVLGAFFTAFLLPSLRFIWKMVAILQRSKHGVNKIRTLIIGAGEAAKIIIDDSKINLASHNQIVVLVDDNKNKIGKSFAELPVRGPISNVSSYIGEFKVEEVIIAISNLSKERLHEIVKLLESSPVRVRRMPILSEMSSPKAQNVVNVDLDDLLCRTPIKLDNEQISNMLEEKTVLVTGAGGSIGSELVMQIFNTNPKTLVLFDIYENSLYDVQQKLAAIVRQKKLNIKVVALIGSTYNEFRVEQLMKKYQPDYIYHAAAYKHVPLMEDSPAEAIRTNVIGTYNVAKLANKYKVKKMVLVSTDKAVRPTNVMGATKRFAETIIQYFSDLSESTSYAAVRFGNVLGSNGSVVPLFMKQIAYGGPVTITDKNIIRYFMTIPEAVSLILQCSLFANGGEIFVLDMGKPVKIYSLAEKLIRQAGFIPDQDIKIIETGLRPGEKLFEELLLDAEHQAKTPNDKIFIEEKENIYPIEEEIKTISRVLEMEETDDVKTLLAQIITTYKITNN